MAKIISILLISYIGCKVTGYDFFTIATLISFALDLYKGILKTHKIIKKYTKEKPAKR